MGRDIDVQAVGGDRRPGLSTQTTCTVHHTEFPSSVNFRLGMMCRALVQNPRHASIVDCLLINLFLVATGRASGKCTCVRTLRSTREAGVWRQQC